MLSQPREHRDSMADGGGGAGMARGRSFAKRWLSRQLLSKVGGWAGSLEGWVGRDGLLPPAVRSCRYAATLQLLCGIALPPPHPAPPLLHPAPRQPLTRRAWA